MSLEIEIVVNEPILLPSVAVPTLTKRPRRKFKDDNERQAAFTAYKKNYYQEKIKGTFRISALLTYYKKKYDIPLKLVHKLNGVSRETLNSYCNAKSGLDLLHKENKDLFKDLFESYVDEQVSIKS